MDYWSGVFGNIVASLIGALAGYYGGTKLFRKQQKEEDKNRLNMIINSIGQELGNHKSILDDYRPYQNIKENEMIPVMIIYPVVAFESAIYAGFLYLLSLKSQYMLSEHYYYCKRINHLIEYLHTIKVTYEEGNHFISEINSLQNILNPVDLAKQLMTEIINSHVCD